LKTAKSLEAARRVLDSANSPAMVSTLAEAEYFAAGGYRDFIYGVGIASSKLDRVGAIERETGARVRVTLDTVEQADAVASWSAARGWALEALIEIDADGHRSGVAPFDAARLTSIAARLASGGAKLAGVLTHAGESYHLSGSDALIAAAAVEADAVRHAAAILRDAGHVCPIVSVGSTPTAMFAKQLDGITEMRAGVYMFGDLFQAGVGACGIGDISISVLAAVIGHQTAKGWTIVDAGWMAMSQDRSTARQAVDQGYGLVCDEQGQLLGDLILANANQEHGIIAQRPGTRSPAPHLSLGTRVRILPNHACATAAQHNGYYVLDDDGRIAGYWPRIRGW
jgi:D-serine deaminase-like pyridoxal phosphate-dependent protein